MDLGLTGKVAIVTGSSDGIGYSVARALAREGARVVLCARRAGLLAEARDKLATETGAEVLAVRGAWQRLPDMQNLIDATGRRFGSIPILVTTGGSVPTANSASVVDAQWYQMLGGKLLPYLRVTREVVPPLLKSGLVRIVYVAG